LHFAVLPGVIALAAGIVCGLAVSIGLIRRMLQQHRAAMMYLIVGLMVGSLFAIAMGPTTLSVAQPALSFTTFSLPGFMVGAGILVALELLKSMMEGKTAGKSVSARGEEGEEEDFE
jgi:putative membrane protein